jgi:hypothetical protein
MTGWPHLLRSTSDGIAPAVHSLFGVVARRRSAESGVMRDYALVMPQFWYGETGRHLRHDRDAQVLAFYLMTCPSASMTGLFYLPIPVMAHETGIPFEGACKALRSLSDAGFAFYDDQTEVVWVPEMARHQIAERLSPGDNRIKGVLRLVERYRRSRYYAAFVERYGAAFNLPERSPFEGPSKALRSQDQEQDQDQDQEQKKIVAPASLSRPPLEVETAQFADDQPEQDAGDEAAEFVESEPVGRQATAASEVAPANEHQPLLFKPDDAMRAISDASNGRFVRTKLKRGQVIHVQRLIRAHPDLAEWRLVGEWLARGGEAWRSEIDSRSLSNFEAWLAHATQWRDAGRPAIAVRAAQRGPNAAGYAPATTAYERSEDLTDQL